MTTATAAYGLAEVVAMFAGLVGVSFAVYLQLISARRPPPHYVVAFFVGGSAMLLLHPAAYLPEFLAWADDGLRLLGAVLALLLELVLAFHVWAKYRVETPGELLAECFGREHDRGT